MRESFPHARSETHHTTNDKNTITHQPADEHENTTRTTSKQPARRSNSANRTKSAPAQTAEEKHDNQDSTTTRTAQNARDQHNSSNIAAINCTPGTACRKPHAMNCAPREPHEIWCATAAPAQHDRKIHGERSNHHRAVRAAQQDRTTAQTARTKRMKTAQEEQMRMTEVQGGTM
jgi:hypothetical protein